MSFFSHLPLLFELSGGVYLVGDVGGVKGSGRGRGEEARPWGGSCSLL